MTLSTIHRRTAIFISFNMGIFTPEIRIQSMDLFFWYVALRHLVPVTGTWCIQTASWFHLQMSKTTYASETWVLKETTIQKLLVFERKILRRIFGPTKENQIWKIKTNEELDNMIKHKNIVNYIKAQRLSWFGHVQRMPDTRTVKHIFKWNPPTKRSHRRPKY